MNCKPGDLAIVVGGVLESLLGRFVTVMHVAPMHQDFVLPDGFGHYPIHHRSNWWVCQFDNPVYPLTGAGTVRQTLYAPIPDSMLRPIQDPGDEEADLLLAPLPQQDKVPA